MALTKGRDSYATVAEADTRISYNTRDTVWAGLDRVAKENWLKLATLRVELYAEWPGWVSESGQERDWPREGVLLRRGRGEYLSRDVTPPEIGWATIELARQMAAEDRISDDVVETLDIRKAGDTGFGGGAVRKPLPDEVKAIIEGSGYGWVPSPGEVKIGRVIRG